MIDRANQAKLAKEILQVVDGTDKVELLESLHKVTATLLELSGFDDNGIVFDLNELTYETLEQAKGSQSSDWKEHTRQSLLSQIDEAQR